MPNGAWTFNDQVTNAFDDMLRRSIPQYDTMRQLTFEVGQRYVQPKTDIVDIGCSRGEALAPFVHHFGARNRYVGLEIAPPMLAAARARFAGYIANRLVEVREHDLRQDRYPATLASLTLSILTLQFVPIEYRHHLLRSIFQTTRPGGALILVEKVLGESSECDRLLVDLYLKHKVRQGYTEEAITRKRLSLENVLVPITAAWNEQFLDGAGFSRVQCFWRCLNFAAWVAVKEDPERN